MAYTEVQIKNKKRYYYLTETIREGKKFRKNRTYLGKDLTKKALEDKIEKADPLGALLSKKEKEILENIKKKSKKTYTQNQYEHFISSFTYNSNAIEGNTLTLQETSLILFDKLTPKGKSLREINEAINHKNAFDYVLKFKGVLNKNFICEIQEIVLSKTLNKELENQIGCYRTLPVRIRGSDFSPPPAKDVPNEMKRLLLWHQKNKKKIHPIVLVSYFHSAFESIHPFADGNGRTGRLIMNFMLYKFKYPLISIPNKEKLDYYNALDSARKGNLRKLIKFVIKILMSTQYTI
jgi:Fic family protein